MGRITNAVGVRLGYTNSWKSELCLLSPEWQENLGFELLEQVENFFKKAYVVKLELIACNINLGVEGGRLYIDVHLYDSQEFLGILVYKRKRVELENFGNEFSLDNIPFMSVYLYNSLRFALLERGLLHLLKGLVPIPISIRFKLVTNENISALLVATYLCVKLKKTYTMGMLLKSLKTVLLSEYNIDGFRIKYSGRFNRKPRATRASLRGGSMSCSTLSSKIDYVERLVILKFGICAIKVWLNKGKNFPEVLGKFYLK